MPLLHHRMLLSTCALLTLTAPAGAQKKDSASTQPKWDITATHGPTDTLQFESDEGTWMAVDVSPDGRRIVFDLLGDIYLLPIAGGEAQLLLGGSAMEVQPRFSPDGKQISFTSDRDGIDNLWIMNVDGSGLKQITKETERQVNNAVWSQDGMYLAGRKHYRNTRSLGAGEMWLYHTGGGSGLQLTKRRNWQQDAGEPELSRDGRYLYYSEDVSPGGGFQYNKDPHGIIYVIQRLDRVTGKSEQFIRGEGGSFRPELSPDGKTLAFVRRVRLKSVLFLYDMESGRETPVFDSLDHDQQEGWAIFGVYPGFSWTPDGRSMVISARGKIWKVDVAGKNATQIPFHGMVKQTVTRALRFQQEVSPEKFDLKMLRWVTVSPDRKSVVFNALGKLWIRGLPEGTPRRLTEDRENLELYPSFSPDGTWIVYATWNDLDMGAIQKIQTAGKKQSRLTTLKGTYIEPSYSPDGSKIVFRKIGGDHLRGELYSKETGIYWMPAEGGTPSLITESGSEPRFTASGERVFLSDSEGEKRALTSIGLHGEQRRVHLVSDNADQIVPSPDERWVAIVERYNVHLAVFPATGQPVEIGPGGTAYPMKRLTRDAGANVHWSADSKTLSWSLGAELFSRELSKTFTFVPGAPDSIPDRPDTTGIPIGFQATTDIPGGSIALVGGRVITMNGDEVVENATILVEGNRIKAVGPSTSIPLPSGTMRVDLSGTTIMPGIIDVHAHCNFGDWSPITNWQYYANLAYGVTTMHDPSASNEFVFSNAEMLKAGLMVGPRLYSTGTILYGAEGSYKAIVNTYDDALSHLRRLRALGAFTVKSYNQPRRDQRQMIIEAGRSLGMMVVPEGGSTFFWNLSMILDGHTGIEHNIPISPLYKDVVTLTARSGTGITPTLIVHYAGLSGEFYWYQKTKVWENERLLRFTPRDVIEARSMRRQIAEDDDYQYIEASRSLKRIVDAGGKVQLGAHGQLQGLGAHWELWMLAQGGMTPLQAIRCATLSGAQYIGLDRDLGSIEPGKLADLLVMSKNPLENIRNSDSVRYVMLNGRLYDAATMNEIGNHPRERGAFYWEK